VKAHLVCVVKTNIVTAVQLTMTNEHDTKFLPELVMQTAQNFTVEEISGDRAYSSRANLELINEIGSVPYILLRRTLRGELRTLRRGRRCIITSSSRTQSF